LLVVGKSFVLAAKELQIDRQTLYRWRQQERFRQAVRKRHRELWGDATERLRMLVGPAVEILAEFMNDRYDRSRFRGAMAVLNLAKLREPD
jgi:transposase-like protein